jgi:hypothetical protein
MAKTTFKIYNVMDNAYVNASTINEAKTRKQGLVSQYLQEKLQDANGQFSVTAVNVDENGNEVWSDVQIESYQIIENPYNE